jgi:hypothetical protein
MGVLESISLIDGLIDCYHSLPVGVSGTAGEEW